MLPKARICEHLDQRAAAAEKAHTFADSPWAGLHTELTTLSGASTVRIYGSAMLGMHLTAEPERPRTIRQDQRSTGA